MIFDQFKNHSFFAKIVKSAPHKTFIEFLFRSLNFTFQFAIFILFKLECFLFDCLNILAFQSQILIFDNLIQFEPYLGNYCSLK